MFRTTMPGRTARVIAAGALIFSLTATTLVGSANAAPLTNNEDCSAAALARTDAVHALLDAWKASTGDLKTLATDAPKLRKELQSAWRELRNVVMQAKEALEDLNCQNGNDDELIPTPGAPAAGTTTLDQSKAIVDQAIKDMQAVVDAARKAIADLASATPSKDTTTDNAVKGENQSAQNTADKVTADNDNEDKDDDAKDNSSEKSKAKSTASTTVKVKATTQRNGHGHGHDD